jgi:hypothetical protein
MNVIDFIMSERDAQVSLRNLRQRDRGGKPGSDFLHPALERGAGRASRRDHA